MTYPLISVIIPVYNGEKFIATAIESVLKQSYVNFEIIVIDDGSTDNTKKIISKFSDPRLGYYFQENQGSPIAKNYGLSIARGEYIQFLDADDAISSDKFFNQIDLIQDKPRCICVCRTMIFYNDDDLNNDQLDELCSEYLFDSKSTFDFLLNLMGSNNFKSGMIQPNAFLTPMALIEKSGQWSEELAKSPDDDSEFFSRVLLAADEIVYDAKSINYYRKTFNYLSGTKKEIFLDGALKTIDLKTGHILRYFDSPEVRLIIAFNYAKFIYETARYYIKYYSLGMERIKKLGVKVIPPVGGGNFKLIRYIVGFRSAITITYVMFKLRQERLK